MRDVKNFIKSGTIVVFNDEKPYLVVGKAYSVKLSQDAMKCAHKTNLWFIRKDSFLAYDLLFNPDFIYSINDITRVYETKDELNLDILEYSFLTNKLDDSTQYNIKHVTFGPNIDFSEYDTNGFKQVWIKEIEQNITAKDALLNAACENRIFLTNIFPVIHIYLNGAYHKNLYLSDLTIPLISDKNIFIKYMLEDVYFRKSIKEELLSNWMPCRIDYAQILEYLREKNT